MTDEGTSSMSEKWAPENPAPDLFTTYERLEVVHRVEVTEENAHLIARHFGWQVDYSGDQARLVKGREHVAYVGAWIDHRGSRWNPEPIGQGYRPAGTYREAVQS